MQSLPRRSPLGIALLLIVLASCADDAPQDNNAPAPDLGAPDMVIADPCEEVDCGDNGRCVVAGGAPMCECPTGLIADGLRCITAPSAPALNNLPAAENGAVGAPDSFIVAASDANGDALTFSVNAAACPFPVTIDASGRLNWTCSSATTCDAAVTVTDPGGLSVVGTLSIACVSGLPSFSSTPPAAATEGVTLRYDVACADPDGQPVTLSIAPDDTCGGALNGSTYVLTPTEAQGGASCLLRILCSDGQAAESQSSTLAVAEVNDAPALNNLPASASALWGRPGAFTVTAADADLPAQPLTFSVANTTCAFPVTVGATSGAVSFTCAAAVESCVANISVSDGQANAQAALSISCTNTPPTAADVAVTRAGDALSCGYTFSDADGDADTSTIEWLKGGVAAGTGPSFTSFAAGDSIACRVTPRDGLTAGPPVTSPAVTIINGLQIASGNSHTCAAKNGAVYCWGDNVGGKLGDGLSSATSRSNPALVAGMSVGVTAISAGGDHTCAIQSGALKCWGRNDDGRLGDGTTTNRATPVQVTGMTAGVTAVSAGDGHTCAIQSGALKCWGANNLSQLGDGTTIERLAPAQVTGMAAGVTDLSAGLSHTCAIQSGALRCWGRNDDGRLGDGAAIDRDTPVQVTGMAAGVTDVSAGTSHTCAIQSGALKCWGSNNNGQLGDGATIERIVPVQVTGLTAGVTDVSAGDSHACAIQSGALRCWGRNQLGQLGDGTTTSRSAPIQVTGMTAGVTAASASRSHTCAIQSGTLKCWGNNESGELAAPGRSQRTPVPVNTIPASDAISVGRFHSCAIQSGALKCWGRNEVGQLGDGTINIDRATPVQVTGMTAGVTAVSVGTSHTCAIQSGALKCWGFNNGGQLGDGTTTDRATPVQVTGMTSGVTAVSAGDDLTCAIQSGALRCWGNNSGGELGDGTTINRNAPVQVTGLTADVTAASAGNSHSCALQSGALKCWGRNDDGRLGDGTTTNRATPVQVTGMTSGVTAVSAGASHTCAVQSGALKCWGFNNRGQLGNSMASNITTIPIQVTDMTADVTAVSAGRANTCAIQSGALKCWGDNSEGQLGDGTNVQRSAPTQVPGLLSGVTDVSADDGHTCAIQSGAPLCWGSNLYSQLSYPLTYPTPRTVALP